MITYDHPQLGEIRAMPVAEYLSDHDVSFADWVAVGAANVNAFGYVVDERADDGILQPSEASPDHDDQAPFAAFRADQAGTFITSTHSLRGALAAIGNDTLRGG